MKKCIINKPFFENKFFLLSVIIFLTTFAIQAQTTINPGIVSGTWKKSGSPYKINGNIKVPKDSVLKIQAGVKVEFQGAYYMVVNGNIQAIGAANDTITFTPANKTTGWQGIELNPNKTQQDSNIFHYCKFEYCKNKRTDEVYGAIQLDTTNTVRISNCLFQYNQAITNSCISLNRSKLKIYNTTFYKNEAVDFSFAAAGASVSCIGAGGYSQISIFNCDFKENKSYCPNIKADTTSFLSFDCVWILGGKFYMNNCKFISNYATSSSCLSIKPFNNNDTFVVNKVDFINNSSYRSNALTIGDYFTQTYNYYSKITNITFYNNKTTRLQYAFSTCLEADNYKGLILKNIQFIKNRGGIAAILYNGRLENAYFAGNSNLSLNTGEARVHNSIFVNNGGGVQFGKSGAGLLINSVVAYNGLNSIDPLGFIPTYGIASGSGYIGGIINSIVIKNVWRNKMVNIVGDNSNNSFTEIRNSIIQGALDSSISFDKSGKLKIVTFTNNISDTVSFVKPPKGYGPAFYDSTADFHINNTCSYYPITINKGINETVYDSNRNTRKYDYDGNPRIQCGIVDIGPYELAGAKKIIDVTTNPIGKSACPGSSHQFNGGVCGIGISYQWQKSKNGINWSNINGADSLKYKINSIADTAYYRYIAIQSQCNSKDTSAAALVIKYPAPVPKLGKDTFLQNNASLLLNPGTFTSYLWNTNATSQTITANKTNLAIGPNKLWVKVKNSFGCEGSDTIVIDLFAKNKNALIEQIKVYPNPARDWLQIASNINQNFVYEIYTSTGTLVEQGAGNLLSTKIGIGNLQSGNYMLKIKTRDGVSGVRFLKE